MEWRNHVQIDSNYFNSVFVFSSAELFTRNLVVSKTVVAQSLKSGYADKLI